MQNGTVVNKEEVLKAIRYARVGNDEIAVRQVSDCLKKVRVDNALQYAMEALEKAEIRWPKEQGEETEKSDKED